MAKKPEPTTAVANYEDRLASLAKQAVQTEAHVGGGSYISTRGGQLSYNGGVVPDGKMNVIVLDHVCENAFYEGRYDPNDPSSPACFAFFRNADEAAPHEKAETPQADACEGCPHNEFGSSDTGRGKACKNIRRLALITEDGMEDIENATVAFLKVPVTSAKEWAGYVNSLNNTLKLPPLAVITELSIVPDSASQFKLKFKLVEKIEDADVLGALLNKMDGCQRDLVHPYMPNSERPAAPAPVNRKVAGNARVANVAVTKPSPKLKR